MKNRNIKENANFFNKSNTLEPDKREDIKH